jgi:hypothetical protein
LKDIEAYEDTNQKKNLLATFTKLSDPQIQQLKKKLLNAKYMDFEIDFPKGKREKYFYETEIQCALRELMEETGICGMELIKKKTMRIIDTVKFQTKDYDQIRNIFFQSTIFLALISNEEDISSFQNYDTSETHGIVHMELPRVLTQSDTFIITDYFKSLVNIIVSEFQ